MFSMSNVLLYKDFQSTMILWMCDNTWDMKKEISIKSVMFLYFWNIKLLIWKIMRISRTIITSVKLRTMKYSKQSVEIVAFTQSQS